MAVTTATIWNWALSFFDTNGDHRLTFMDLCVLVAGSAFTLKMLGFLPEGSPDDPTLWTVFIVSIASLAGLTKVAEAIKREPYNSMDLS